MTSIQNLTDIHLFSDEDIVFSEERTEIYLTVLVCIF